MTPEQVAQAEARMLAELVTAGRRAAALNGRHLFVWGVVASLVLAIQFLAETRDWLPSRILWLWQPVVLAGFTASIFMARRGAGRRLGNPVSRAYALSFAAVGVAIALHFGAAALTGLPDGLATALLLCGTMGGAFLLVALSTPHRWMLAPAAGWFALLAFFLSAGRVIPLDWLRLSLSVLLLVAGPGVVLMLRRPL
jgi:hypothetical protein